jgi:hypothetical protein
MLPLERHVKSQDGQIHFAISIIPISKDKFPLCFRRLANRALEAGV